MATTRLCDERRGPKTFRFRGCAGERDGKPAKADRTREAVGETVRRTCGGTVLPIRTTASLSVQRNHSPTIEVDNHPAAVLIRTRNEGCTDSAAASVQSLTHALDLLRRALKT